MEAPDQLFSSKSIVFKLVKVLVAVGHPVLINVLPDGEEVQVFDFGAFKAERRLSDKNCFICGADTGRICWCHTGHGYDTVCTCAVVGGG